MRCDVTDDPGLFWEWAEAFLVRDPVVNGVLLTNVVQRVDGTVVDSTPPTFVAVRGADGAVVGAAMRTLPTTAYVSRLPGDAVAALVRAFQAASPWLTGVTGTKEDADAVARAWCETHGTAFETVIAQRIHVLDRLLAPVGVRGHARLAGHADAGLVEGWERQFAEEAESALDPAARVRGAALRIAERRAWFWEHNLGAGAEPVSYVGHTGRVAGAVRIGPVYTPPERRGHGYASALVAGVSRRALDDGAEHVYLYTDLANPTSNKIYAAVGYRPRCDVASLRFVPGS
ncbi:MAG: GNAT family N-acetyltransferase [Streptosporangiales bacterium]